MTATISRPVSPTVSHSTRLDFAAVVAPNGVTAFIDDHWERTPFLGRGPAGRFAPLLTIDDFETVLTASPREVDGQPGVYAVQTIDGTSSERGVHLDRFGRPSTAPATSRSMSSVNRALRDGHTIVVNHLAGFHRPIAELCANATQHVQHHFGANLYLTPAGAQGFGSHFDSHETFFLQIEGSKRWRVWAPPAELPLVAEPPQGSVTMMRAPDLEIELTAGDVLYLPRGWIHEGVATDELSLHVTLGCQPRTWFDLMVQELRSVADRRPELRRGLPLHAEDASDESIAATAADHWRSIAADLGRAEVTAIKTLRADRLTASSPVTFGQLERSLHAEETVPSDIVTRHDGLNPLVSRTRDGVRLVFPGSHLDAPDMAEPALRHIVEHKVFRVDALPGLSGDAACALVEELIVLGLLRSGS